MKLLLSSLLLASLCAPSSRSEQFQTAVTQTPEVRVTEGAQLNISCCWTCGGKVRIKWWKSDNGSQRNDVISENLYQGVQEIGCCDFLIIPNITTAQSGKYICEVTQEIPVLTDTSGNGTVVMVTPRDNKEGNKSDIISPSAAPSPSSPSLVSVAVPLAVVTPLLVAALLLFCLLRRRRRREMAARVIYEVPHVDSDVDKRSSGSSTGSSQWCQVLVYESVDYFQHVERK